jgi:hypothetical protein
VVGRVKVEARAGEGEGWCLQRWLGLRVGWLLAEEVGGAVVVLGREMGVGRELVGVQEEGVQTARPQPSSETWRCH